MGCFSSRIRNHLNHNYFLRLIFIIKNTWNWSILIANIWCSIRSFWKQPNLVFSAFRFFAFDISLFCLRRLYLRLKKQDEEKERRKNNYFFPRIDSNQIQCIYLPSGPYIKFRHLHNYSRRVSIETELSVFVLATNS